MKSEEKSEKRTKGKCLGNLQQSVLKILASFPFWSNLECFFFPFLSNNIWLNQIVTNLFWNHILICLNNFRILFIQNSHSPTSRLNAIFHWALPSFRCWWIPGPQIPSPILASENHCTQHGIGPMYESSNLQSKMNI